MRPNTIACTLLAIAAGTFVVGCAADGDLEPEVIQLPALDEFIGMTPVGRFYAEIDPLQGAIDIYRVDADGKVRRDQPVTAAVYDYGSPLAQATCTGTNCSQTDRVYLYTSGDVTYIQNGNCYRNGTTYTGDTTCGGLYTGGSHTCRQDRVFCGPLRLTHDFRHGGTVGALPNVVVDIKMVTAGSIDTCRDSAVNAGTFGTCQRSNAANAAKITGATSDFTPSIPAGGGNRDTSCALCYGNYSTTNMITGLRNAVMSGSGGINTQTNTVALHIPSTWNANNAFGVTFDVLASSPVLEPATLQLTYTNAANTTVTCVPYTVTANQYFLNHAGNGFGPPAPCFGATPGSTCTSSLTQAPDSRYRATMYSGTGATPSTITPTLWSDTAVRTPIPAGTHYGCTTSLTTPMGNVNTGTSDNLKICANDWRKWTSTTQPSQWGAAAALGTDIVTVGVNGTGSGTRKVTYTPMPRCGAIQPVTTSVSAVATAMPAALGDLDLAYTEYNDELYIFGGLTRSSGNCRSGAARLTWNSTTHTGTWTSLANMPGNLCGASAAPVTDTNGRQKIVVMGGTTTNGGTLATTVYVYDVVNNNWATTTITGMTDLARVRRYFGSAASFGDNALFAGGYNNSGNANNTTTRVTVSGGTASLATGPSLVGLLGTTLADHPGMAVIGTNLYFYTTVSGNGRMYRSASSGTGAWSLLGSTATTFGNSPHLVVSNFDETAPNADLNRLFMFAEDTQIMEFNP